MALINRAFCYTQIKDSEKAKELYKKALEECPDSGMAKAGLNMMNSLKNKQHLIKLFLATSQRPALN